MRKQPFANFDSWPIWKLWLLFFIFTWFTGALIQLVIIPRFIPPDSVEAGLLVAGDSVAFHNLAVSLAKKIQIQGWAAWLLWPRGQGPAGIAAAIYAVTIPEPWVLLPLNAALHATSGILIILILELFVRQRWVTFFSSIPFVTFPTAMLWYAQIHKDSYTIPGSLMFMLGWAWLAKTETWKSQRIYWAIFLILAGSGLIWIMRPYQVEIFQLLVALASPGLIGLYLMWWFKNKWQWLPCLLASLVTLALVAVLTPLAQNTPTTNTRLSDLRPEPAPPLITNWQPTPWLPTFIEQKVRAFGESREHYLHAAPGTDLDTEVQFRNFSEMLCYVPRGIQIGLLAPFPNLWPELWFGQGSQHESIYMRRSSVIELLFVYSGLAGSIFMLWRFRTRPDFWLLVYLCVGIILSYSMVVINLGTLYRFRYAFIMVLASTGFAFILDRSASLKARLHTSPIN